ncbi:MAG: STAS domain-containing protein [Candidatus Poribacteria bacterium]
MQRDCTINTYESDNMAIISILGDLTSSVEESMKEAYKKACGYKTDKIIFKFDGKSRINSTGIAIMIDIVIQSQEENRKIFITGVSKHFHKIFDLVGLSRYTTIVESEEEVKNL